MVPRDRAEPERPLVATLVLWSALQVAVVLLVGIAGQLRAAAVVGVEAVLLLLGFAGLGLRRPSAAAAAPSSHSAGERLLVALWALVGISLLLRLASHTVTEHDSLAYHLPAVARWFQAGTFVPLENFRRMVTYYPYDWESLALLFVIPFGEDFLVTVPNLVAWVIFGLSTSLTARQLGADRTLAVAAGILVSATAMARGQVSTLQVDLALGAFFVAALYFAVTYRTTGAPVDAALWALATALVLGIKTTGLVYGLILAVAFAISCATRPAAARAARAGRSAIVLLTAAITPLVGGYWYARNVWRRGNPLGNIRVELFGTTLLPGDVDPASLGRTALAHVFHPARMADWGELLGAVWHEGRLPIVLLVVGTLGVLGARRTGAGRAAVALLVALAITLVIQHAVTPLTGEVGPHDRRIGSALRYAFPLLGVIGVLGALGATAMAGRRAEAVAVAAVGAAFVGTVSSLMLPGGLLILGALGGRLLWRRSTTVSGRAALAGIAAVASFAGSLALRQAHSRDRAAHFGAVQDFLNRQLPDGEPLGYLLGVRSYPLYGADLRRRVVWAPGTSDRESWLEALDRRAIRMVAAGPVPPYWRRRQELTWLAAEGSFERVFGGDVGTETLIYELKSRGH